MRLDAREGDHGWNVWHCEEVRPVRRCVWVDDQLHQYAVVAIPVRPQRDGVALDVHQAKSVRIVASSRLVLINEIDESVADALTSITRKPATV